MSDQASSNSSETTGLTPHIVVSDAAAALAFYGAAFGANELFRMPMPDGPGIMHAEMEISGFRVMLAEEMPSFGSKSPVSLGGTPVTLHLSVTDVDAAFAKASAAGAAVVMPPTDMFWGDRYSRLTDPFGHSWALSTHVRDLTPEEIAEAAKAAFAG